ncbi:hypothetical protein PAMP_009719 [Pampus punctatissimus]
MHLSTCLLLAVFKQKRAPSSVTSSSSSHVTQESNRQLRSRLPPATGHVTDLSSLTTESSIHHLHGRHGCLLQGASSSVLGLESDQRHSNRPDTFKIHQSVFALGDDPLSLLPRVYTFPPVDTATSYRASFLLDESDPLPLDSEGDGRQPVTDVEEEVGGRGAPLMPRDRGQDEFTQRSSEGCNSTPLQNCRRDICGSGDEEEDLIEEERTVPGPQRTDEPNQRRPVPAADSPAIGVWLSALVLEPEDKDEEAAAQPASRNLDSVCLSSSNGECVPFSVHNDRRLLSKRPRTVYNVMELICNDLFKVVALLFISFPSRKNVKQPEFKKY